MSANDQPQPIVPMTAVSLVVWGQIVKAIATNVGHLRPPPSLQPDQPAPLAGGPAPTQPLLADAAARMANTAPGDVLAFSRAEFQALLNESMAGITLPDEIDEVRLIQSGGGTLVVRLPARQKLLERENDILKTRRYQPASFIDHWYARPGDGPVPTVDEAMDMHDALVGDYAITHCM